MNWFFGFSGLFAQSHLHYHLEKEAGEPSLREMTQKAIQILQKEKNGFFLFVEGGRIDMAHHEVRTRLALDETLEFAKAVQTAHEMTNERDTLIVVTADHSHTMSFSGYPARGYDILNIFGKSADGLPYATLSYPNGPGYHPQLKNGSRYNLEHDHFGKKLREFSIKKKKIKCRRALEIYENIFVFRVPTYLYRCCCSSS